MTIISRLAAFCAALLLLAPTTAVGADQSRFRADTDAFIRRAMGEVGVVPGLAIAVADGDGTVLTAGYGIADLATGDAVDADTRFYIASSTKSFTALAVAAMAMRGEIDMKASLAPWATDLGLPAAMAAGVSLNDLLSHRSGLDNSPMAFRAALSGDHTPEIMRGLLGTTVVLTEAPQGTFRYSNAGYNLATTLLTERFGRDWRDLVDDEVLAPVGMTDTIGWVSRASAGGAAVAAGHLGYPATGTIRSPLQKVDATMQSAGGLFSTAHDMARWLEVQVNDGVVDGRRIFPEGLVASTHRSLVGQAATFGPYTREGYGLGWQVGHYGDDVLIHHFGNFAGSRAHVSFMPGRRLGVAVMVNEDTVAGDLADLIANYVYDWHAALPDLEAVYADRLQALVDRRDQAREAIARGKADRATRPWNLTRPISAYVGTYENPLIGTVRVSERDGAMIVTAGVMNAVAEPLTRPESVRVELTPLQGQVIEFEPTGLIFMGERFERR
jgi:CubicO group peptidase (beta-lactamase class C family)